MVAAGVLRPDDRVELILGVLYDLSPRRSRHTAAVHKMLDALRAAYSDVGAHVRVQSPLRLGGDSQPEPDLAVVSGAIDDSIDSHPTVYGQGDAVGVPGLAGSGPAYLAVADLLPRRFG